MGGHRQGGRGRPRGAGGQGAPAPPQAARPRAQHGDEEPARGGRDATPPPVIVAAPAPAAPAGEPVRAVISSMAYGGEAVARLEDGTVVFVWGALPGEEVLVDITDRRKRFWRGQVRAVLAASPERVAPPCPIFGVCGGCQWQYMAYPAQVEAKQAILLEQVRQAVPDARERLRPPVAMADPWHYRNVAHFIGDEARRPCFRRWQSHDLVAVEHCPITQAPVNAALPPYHGDLIPGERLSLRCTADGRQIQAWRGEMADPAERTIVEDVLGYRYQISPRAFFQVNTKRERRAPLSWPRDGQEDPAAAPTSLTEDLVRLVLEGVEGYTDQTVVDAYCGVGLFALPLAARAPRVIGIEEAETAVLDALANAAGAGLTNTVFLHGAAGALLPAVAEPMSAVVLDPPRTGVEERALRAIVGKGVPRVVYVSCNPPTLGRDLALLTQGGYQLDWLRLIDLFPQTLHIESVAVLTLR
jgi:23S rRNA (uracil1939-C5)-methyltransferase